ncbi:alpha/beta hydrolase-fold protein [Hymenobacter lucidus]|uniref:Alpha/beta hydrolase n=1 Tax=Hymenobacter lucidus TaxID=2880930 RepID=A0ABS8ANP2_9BACT|nr:alpha/beta hydrolase-fold protein [Hymenobacter lucidus]MCB2407374.1 alpha/beta hydrolase [Hymenobacter lucidus]
MSKILQSAFWLLLTHLLIHTAAAQPTNPIIIGHIDSLNSKTLQEKRGVWIYVPPASPEIGYAPKRYPVLYVLDGDWNFPFLTALTQQLSTVNSLGICPEMIVVGIPNTYRTRTRDLTPTHSTKRWDGAEDRTLSSSGGGGNFMAFLEMELLPYIDSKYPTVPYRLFAGHSLGGLTVLNTLATKPELFNAYLAIEPSLWWDNRLVLNKMLDRIQQREFHSQKLFLAVAHTAASLDTTQVRHDTTGSTIHTRANLALVDALRRQQPATLRWSWKYYSAENHASVAVPAYSDALHAFFRHPPLALPASVADPAFTLAAIQQQYASRSRQYGYVVPPPEEELNMYAWACMQQQLWAKALQFFQFNLNTYPQSFNAHTGLAAYYEARNDKRKALQYYQAALRIQDLPEARQKIQELQQQTGKP